MAGRIVIAVYRPKPGKAAALEALVAGHVPALQRLGLATARAPIAMRAEDGSVVEVFEWASAEATEAAHSHPAVLALWAEFETLCTWVEPNALPEMARTFPDFTPLGS